MFGFFKRLKEKRLAKAKAKREAYQARKAMIDRWHRPYYSKQYDKREAEYKAALEEAEKKNSVCPKCGSTNVVNHIRRIKGSLHGEGEVHGGFALLSGYVSGHSEINGELDTFPVCRCNDCSNEWYVKVPKKKDVEDEFSQWDYLPRTLVDHVYRYLTMKYDPDDLDEEFDSLEEKKADFINSWNNSYLFKTYRYCPRYMIDVAFWAGMQKYWRNDELGPFFGNDDDLDEYSYIMPDKLWEVVKLVIGWKGTEE